MEIVTQELLDQITAQARDSVAVWEEPDPDMGTFRIFVGGLSGEFVADEVLEAIRTESFLVLPHPEVLQYFRAKANDYERWLGGMQKLYLRKTQ